MWSLSSDSHIFSWIEAFFVFWPEQGKLVGPLTLQARDPLLRLSSQLWRRLQGQPLPQRYGGNGWWWQGGEHRDYFPHTWPCFCDFTRRWQLGPTTRGNRGKQLHWAGGPSQSAEALVQAQPPHSSPCQTPHRDGGAAEEWSGQHTTDV